MIAHEEKLEDLSRAFGFPHAPEFELGWFRDLFGAELREALRTAAPTDHAWRGRLRRLLGDKAGAAADLSRALDLDPENARAHKWLGEAASGTPQGQASLTRAIELGSTWARLYRRAPGDLERFLQRHPKSALGHMLAGRYADAARLAPHSAAAQLLLARAGKEDAMIRAMEAALDADPDYAHTVLARFEPGSSWHLFLKRLRAFAFARDRHLPVCLRFELEDLQYAPYHADAVAKAERIHKDHKDSAWALALVGRALSRLHKSAGRQGEALQWFDGAIERAPGAGWLYAWRALARAKQGDDAGALADLDLGLAKQPYYYRAYAWRGALLRKLGRAKDALGDLDRAVPVDGLYPFLIHERSLARRSAGEPAAAALDLERAFRLDQRYRWCGVAGSAAELARGAAELDQALMSHPTSVSLRVWKGEVLLQQNDAAAAFQELSAAARLEPQNALAQGWLAVAELRSGRPAEAAARLRRTLSLEPGLWAAYGWLAEARAALKDIPGAFSVLAELLRRRPKAAWAWRQRAALRLSAGRAKAALADARRALELEGRSADGWYLLAEIQDALGALAPAREAVERALAVSPDLGRAYLLRARIGQRQGRAAEVIGDYRTVLERFPYLFNAEQKQQVEALLS